MTAEPKARNREIAEARPVFDDREIDAVVQVLRRGNFDLGRSVRDMEAAVAALLGKQHGVMVNSGTSALWLAVDLLGCEPGDEVITSPLTFSSDVAPLVRNGIVPAFVDVEADTLQIDSERIEEMISPRTKAILAPNLVGNCPDWDVIRAVADAHGLIVIEDSCDVIGSHLRGTRTGLRAEISVTSFARGHAITAAGNGGLIAVNNPDWFNSTLVRRRWGRRSEKYFFGTERGNWKRFGQLPDGTDYDMVFVFDDMGYNFEPSEIMAAFGLVQLQRLDEFNAIRQRNYHSLNEALEPHQDKVIRSRTLPELNTTWMRFPFLLADGIDRSDFQQRLLERGVPSRMIWTGNILRQPGFINISHRMPASGLTEADRVMDRGLCLPSHNGLAPDDVAQIADALSTTLNEL
ncbi:DegT/DnrJ/EryC1/StrS family aminotransferase [Mycobacterium sp. NPDC051804]|uniref:DegT/DnrJ/EryC1/StrS family aminotransferase n=1 Tax=Mycobacterium sp. NPDC051804 TaxID=3364295 RepID=UPI0037A88692